MQVTDAFYHLDVHYGEFVPRYLSYEYTETPVGKWIHFAGSTDSMGMKLYVNGQQVAANDIVIDNTYVESKKLAIGVNVSGAGDAPFVNVDCGYTAGAIDEVRIYNRALSLAEIQQLAGQPAAPWSNSTAQASTLHGSETAANSNVMNCLTLLIIPIGAVIFLKIMRRKK